MSKQFFLILATGLIAATSLQANTPIENMKAEAIFLRDNREKEGIKVTDSGLQYEIITQGEGKKPGLTSRVKVHYRGTLLDGKVFDSSYTRGEPAVFGVNQVIAGWTEALQLMPEGSTWKLYIPSKIAYGARGAGSTIGPNECLIFKVELIEIVE